jgi:hypothetical protein
MWSSLPSNLRTVLGTALLLGIGVAAAAFTLSFFALRDAAADPALRWGQGHAWLFPIGVDMALIFFEVLLLGASMVRVQDAAGQVVQYPRQVPFLLVMVAAASTLYFNATRVPDHNGLRLVALAVPVASILVTLGLAYLLKMLAATTGSAAIHLAPVATAPNRIVRATDVVHGEILRDPGVAPEMEPPSVTRTELGQTEPGKSGDGGGGATTKQHILDELERLSPEDVVQLGPEGITVALAERGVETKPRYVRRVMDERAAALGWSTNGHRKP